MPRGEVATGGRTGCWEDWTRGASCRRRAPVRALPGQPKAPYLELFVAGRSPVLICAHWGLRRALGAWPAPPAEFSDQPPTVLRHLKYNCLDLDHVLDLIDYARAEPSTYFYREQVRGR